MSAIGGSLIGPTPGARPYMNNHGHLGGGWLARVYSNTTARTGTAPHASALLAGATEMIARS